MRSMSDEFLIECDKLGKVIAALRKQAGISQEELAFRASIDRTYISQIERGVGNPSLLVIFKIAQALKVSMSFLFQES
jgi:transcriptional regulator with XRE-family HTH domain